MAEGLRMTWLRQPKPTKACKVTGRRRRIAQIISNVKFTR
jgi:hypothetical protein